MEKNTKTSTIILSNGLTCFVDTKNLVKILEFSKSWQYALAGNNYKGKRGSARVRATKDGQHWTMANVIMNLIPSRKWVVDHMDGNELNNRESNLRIVTRKVNSMNREGSDTRKVMTALSVARQKSYEEGIIMLFPLYKVTVYKEYIRVDGFFVKKRVCGVFYNTIKYLPLLQYVQYTGQGTGETTANFLPKKLENDVLEAIKDQEKKELDYIQNKKYRIIIEASLKDALKGLNKKLEDKYQ